MALERLQIDKRLHVHGITEVWPLLLGERKQKGTVLAEEPTLDGPSRRVKP